MGSRTARKRCVCGKSSRMPLCDGTHEAEGWRCSARRDVLLQFAFAASPSLENLADRLAHACGGTSLKAPAPGLVCRKLVIISDGAGLEGVLEIRASVQANEVIVLAVDAPEGVMPWAFGEARHVALSGEMPAMLWRQAQVALAGSSEPVAAQPRPHVFVSHAVEDEPLVMPIVTALRDHYAIPLFVCLDSIRAGAQWHKEICDHVARCDVFIYLASAAANASTFCAFEAGLAAAMEKPVFIVSLDGAAPPSHLQHIQSADVPRVVRSRPWLTAEDAALEAVLDALGSFASRG